jgi:hypothetical protein
MTVYDWCPCKKRKFGCTKRSRCVEAILVHSEKMTTCKPRAGISGETNCADNFFLDCQPPDCEKINF